MQEQKIIRGTLKKIAYRNTYIQYILNNKTNNP